MHRIIIDIYPVYPFNPLNLVQNDGLISIYLTIIDMVTFFKNEGINLCH